MTSNTDQLDLSDMDSSESSVDFFSRLCDEDTFTIKRSSYISFICPQCGVSFDINNDWRQHINDAHNLSDINCLNFKICSKNRFKCQTCDNIITRCTQQTLQQHHFMHLPHKIYNCKLCAYEANSMYLIISHIMLHKNSEDLTHFANAKNESSAQGNSALDDKSDQLIAYICPDCGHVLPNEETWQAHINFQHDFLQKAINNQFVDHFKCYICSTEIYSQHIIDMQEHLFTHLRYKSYLKCKICNWTNSRRNFIISHIRNLHKHQLSDMTALTSIKNNADGESKNKLLTENLNDKVKLAFSTTLTDVAQTLNDDYNNIRQQLFYSNGNSGIAAVGAVVGAAGGGVGVGNNGISGHISHYTIGGGGIGLEGFITSQPTLMNSSQIGKCNKTKKDYASKKRRGPGFSCSGCDRLFKTAAERNEHNIHACKPKYKCDLCETSFALKNVYKYHRCVKLNGKRLKM